MDSVNSTAQIHGLPHGMECILELPVDVSRTRTESNPNTRSQENFIIFQHERNAHRFQQFLGNLHQFFLALTPWHHKNKFLISGPSQGKLTDYFSEAFRGQFQYDIRKRASKR